MRTLKPMLVALAGVLLCSAPALASSGHHGSRHHGHGHSKIHITGTAYAFDNQLPIAGATIRVAELPKARATSAADGSYDLVVPAGKRVTPYIEAAGFHGIYLQTSPESTSRFPPSASTTPWRPCSASSSARTTTPRTASSSPPSAP
jgi:hypothetical protein